MKTTNGKQAFGDYQTPVEFAKLICDYLHFDKHVNPSVVLEPTCGIGNFLESSLSFHAERYYGIEINPTYCAYCRKRITDQRVSIINSDFFVLEPKKLFPDTSDILIIGNPPWVTNSKLSMLMSDNVPVKTNFKNLKGLDAVTGASNFDICEYMILHLLHEFRNTNTVISMLCKTTVARNVFCELKRNHINFEYIELLEFDAAKIFGVSVSACDLIIKLSPVLNAPNYCNVYTMENRKKPKYSLHYEEGKLLSHVQRDDYDFEGTCCFSWRQGLKHDCSKIMELSKKDGIFYNGNHQVVDIEPTLIYPLAKSSTFKAPVISTFSKYVLVTQRYVREDTGYIKTLAPKTWRYLCAHTELFQNRKSAIYRGAPMFSMFGIGGYSYSKFKVGISGFYKRPLFSLLYIEKNRPVMTDDTSYFLGFDDFAPAYVAMLFLNSEPVQTFLTGIAFLDAKRPYTKKVLARLSFEKMLYTIQYETLKETERKLSLAPCLTETMYRSFAELVERSENARTAAPGKELTP